MFKRAYYNPSSQVKIYRKCKDVYSMESFKTNKENIINQAIDSLNTVRKEEYHANLVKIQMISSNLHKQLFPEAPRTDPDESNKKTALLCRRYLAYHKIDIKKTERLNDVNLKLPLLKGNNIEEHFRQIANEQVKPYKNLLIPLVNLKKLPDMPKHWALQAGWTMYDTETGMPHSVEWPLEDNLIFDVEVCMADGAIPTLATAVSTKCWYSWTSPRLACTNPEEKPTQRIPQYGLSDLIPLGLSQPKIVIGHNVSYDRARLREQYLLQDTGVRFLDTMSLHVCVSGVTSYQRAMLKSKKEPTIENMEWLSKSSLNNLADVHNLYCGTSLSGKHKRNVFVEGSLDDVRRNFQDLTKYCAEDVKATHRILQKLFPLFMERFPHPVTLSGMLEMGSAYLPVNKNWQRFVDQSDKAYEKQSHKVKSHLIKRAIEACALIKDDKYKENLWLWNEDWSVRKSNRKSKTQLEISSILANLPAWYRKLCKKSPKTSSMTCNANGMPIPTQISTGMQIVPKLLSLCWEGYPLHYTRKHGWGFLVPFRNHHREDDNEILNAEKPRIPIEKLSKFCSIPEFAKTYANEMEFNYDYDLSSMTKDLDAKLGRLDYFKKIPSTKKNKDLIAGLYKGTGVWCSHIVDDCCFFFKLPHKNGKSKNVGNPLARDFLQKFSENTLTCAESETSLAAEIIETVRMTSYWRNNRDRIYNQLIIWLELDRLPECLQQHANYVYGAICPQVVVCGTLTRRAMEPTWMTASNSQKERIGSELRAMVQAPPSYRIVGADVDSQELWIASVLGDAHAYSMHGATPLGWMTLSGNKANGTDMHSITAKAVGISRDHAKVINYARIYGAGQNFAEGLLKQFNPKLTDAEARAKAVKMFTLTKGKKVYKVKEDFRNRLEDRGYTGYEAFKLAADENLHVSEMFERPYWDGGTESAMFNCLEKIATAIEPVTPFLKCRLSRALESSSAADENRFLPTRINWVVQSGAVDFLHLMLVSMRWLMNTNVRFCLSFHDELRYLVHEEYAYKAAFAMHVTNLLTRSFCSSRLGLNDLPMSVAFFSSVEVDTVLRKECNMDCKTPSNPDGLHKGYGIPPGESLSIHDAIEKAGGNNMALWDWIK